MMFQRDAFISELLQRAKRDPDIFFLSADFGAPALDAFRDELPEQFIHCGISEQNMVDVAAGLALDGRKVFIYGMAPFVSLRCLEQHKCASGLMNLPVCTIVAGVGLGYADAGPTHYATEDLACLRAIVNSHVLTASDARIARAIAEDAVRRPRFLFARLDRHTSPDFEPAGSVDDVVRGFRILKTGSRLCVISQGHLLHAVSRAIEDLGRPAADVAIVDMISSKPIPRDFLRYLESFEAVLAIEEQTPSGGLSAAILEAMADAGMLKPFQRMTLPERFFYENGGREALLKLADLTPATIGARVGQILGQAAGKTPAHLRRATASKSST
jgi:transketolase